MKAIVELIGTDRPAPRRSHVKATAISPHVRGHVVVGHVQPGRRPRLERLFAMSGDAVLLDALMILAVLQSLYRPLPVPPVFH